MRRFSAWILLHRKKILIISTFVSFLYFVWGVNSFKYSYVGDLWPFYTFAKNTLNTHYAGNPFNFDGVFGINSGLASWYQAFFMELFGTSNFAWRLSNIILIIPMSYFFYKWLRLTFDWKIATIATILLQFSFYLSTFFKIGYINPQALALFIPTLYYAALSGIQPTKRNAFILGNLLGLSFYIYLGPIFPLIIWPYFLQLRTWKPKRKLVPYFATLILSYCVWISFFLPSMASLDGPQGKTVLHNEFYNSEQILTNIGNNLQVYYKDFNVIYTHFIPFPYLDIVTQGLTLIGTIAVIGFVYERKFRYLLLVYLSTVIVLGVTNPYAIPPTSRGMLLVIFGFVFAAIGLVLLNKIKLLRGRVVVPLLLVIIAINIYTGYYASFEKMGYTSMGLLLKSLQETHAAHKKETVLLLSESAPLQKDLDAYMSTMQEAYGVQSVRLTILRPHTVSCAEIANKKIYYFSYDRDAVQWMKERKCADRFVPKLLTTSIWYY